MINSTDPVSAFGARRESNLGLVPDESYDHLYHHKPPSEEDVQKMQGILTNMLALADDKRKTEPLLKSPKSSTYVGHVTSYKPVFQFSGRKATNFDHQDELVRPVHTLESITHLFAIVVKVLSGYEFTEKPDQDLLTIHKQRTKLFQDKRVWAHIKTSFSNFEKSAKMSEALDKAEKILISRGNYLKNIQYQRIVLVATSIIMIVGILLAKNAWSYLGLGACVVNVCSMFMHYISSTETQAKLICELKYHIQPLQKDFTGFSSSH